jgi:uncharacterized protein with GYD domain
MAKAFLLIETSVGQTKDVYRILQDIKIKEIKSLDVVTGPYDIIAIIEHDDQNAIGALIIDKIRPIAGIVRTVTCLGVNIS